MERWAGRRLASELSGFFLFCTSVRHTRDLLGASVASVFAQARIVTCAQLQRKIFAEAIYCSEASACTPSTRAATASLPALRCHLMIYTILQRVPGGHGVRVFTGVCLVLGIGCAPVLYKKTRAGHDYFSSEKPEAVERGTVHGV